MANECNKRLQLNVINVPFLLLFFPVGTSTAVASATTPGQHPLHGIYDNGGCSLDHNEALTASYLYPELYNVTSSRPRRHQRPPSSVSTVSSSTITASSQSTVVSLLITGCFLLKETCSTMLQKFQNLKLRLDFVEI